MLGEPLSRAGTPPGGGTLAFRHWCHTWPDRTLRGSVLLKHPQIQGPARRSLGNGPGNTGQQRPIDATPPTVVGDGQVLDEAGPPVVVVEEDVPEAISPDSSSATMVMLLDGRASLADQTDRNPFRDWPGARPRAVKPADHLGFWGEGLSKAAS